MVVVVEIPDRPFRLDTSDHRMRRLVASAVKAGSLVRMLPAIYCPSHLVDDFAARVEMARLWVPDGVIVGDAALRMTLLPDLEVTEILIAGPRRRPRPGFRVTRRMVPRDQIHWIGGVACLSPQLAALDRASTDRGEAVDAYLRERRGRGLPALQDALRAQRYRRGTAARRRILHESRAEPWSQAERIAHQLLWGAKIRGWLGNAPVHGFFIDIAFGREKVAIEIDGQAFHSSPEHRANDARKSNALAARGWIVLRFTWRMLVDDPEEVLRTIRRALQRSRRASRTFQEAA